MNVYFKILCSRFSAVKYINQDTVRPRLSVSLWVRCTRLPCKPVKL